MAGNEQELNQYSGLWGQKDNVLTNKVPSISTATGQIFFDDEHTHWATQGIALYRDFIELPLEGEPPVYEELFHLSIDPNESLNLINDKKYRNHLERMRKAWKSQIHMR